MSFTFGDAFILGGLLGIAEEVRRNHQKEYHNVQIKDSTLVVIPSTLELKKASLKIEGVHPDDALALLCLIACDHKELSTQEAFNLLNTWKANKLHDYFSWFANQFNEGNSFEDQWDRSLRWNSDSTVRREQKKHTRRTKKVEEDPTYLNRLLERAANIQCIKSQRLKNERRNQDRIFGLPSNLIGAFLTLFIVLGMAYSNRSLNKRPEYKSIEPTQEYKDIKQVSNKSFTLVELGGEEFTAWVEPSGNSITIIPTHNLGYPLDYLHQTTLYSYCNQLSGRGAAPISLKVNNNWVDFKQGKGRASVNYYQANGGLIIESISTNAKLTFPKQSISCY